MKDPNAVSDYNGNELFKKTSRIRFLEISKLSEKNIHLIALF